MIGDGHGYGMVEVAVVAKVTIKEVTETTFLRRQYTN
jgi:hypothetical protein